MADDDRIRAHVRLERRLIKTEANAERVYRNALRRQGSRLKDLEKVRRRLAKAEADVRAAEAALRSAQAARAAGPEKAAPSATPSLFAEGG